MSANTVRYRGLVVATSEPALPTHCISTVRVLAAELPSAIRLLFVEDDELLRAVSPQYRDPHHNGDDGADV